MVSSQNPFFGSARSILAAVAVATGLCLLATAPLQAQEEAAETTITGPQADAILKELKAIRGVLEKIQKQGLAQGAKRPARPTTGTVSVKDRPALGAADAPVTVVEFTDFQCPFCKRFLTTTFPKLKESYIDTGKVRWVLRDMPLGFHKDARKAAQAAHCADDQGKYWEMRDTLFRNNRDLTEPKLHDYAKVTGLDMAEFEACLASDKHLDHIDLDSKDAAAVRITGTPTFVVGKTAEDKVSGRIVVGAQPLAVFQSAIDALIKK